MIPYPGAHIFGPFNRPACLERGRGAFAVHPSEHTQREEFTMPSPTKQPCQPKIQKGTIRKPPPTRKAVDWPKTEKRTR